MGRIREKPADAIGAKGNRVRRPIKTATDVGNEFGTSSTTPVPRCRDLQCNTYQYQFQIGLTNIPARIGGGDLRPKQFGLPDESP